jgi:hypothetical protein
MSDALARPDGESRAALQVEEGDSAVFELLADDSFGFEPQCAACMNARGRNEMGVAKLPAARPVTKLVEVGGEQLGELGMGFDPSSDGGDARRVRLEPRAPRAPVHHRGQVDVDRRERVA